MHAMNSLIFASLKPITTSPVVTRSIRRLALRTARACWVGSISNSVAFRPNSARSSSSIAFFISDLLSQCLKAPEDQRLDRADRTSEGFCRVSFGEVLVEPEDQSGPLPVRQLVQRALQRITPGDIRLHRCALRHRGTLPPDEGPPARQPAPVLA